MTLLIFYEGISGEENLWVTKSIMARIVRLTSYAAKGIPGEMLESARLLTGLGMEGDYHAKGGERQLSLLCLETRQWIEAQTEPGLCFSRFKENILFDGITPLIIAPGVRLKIAEVHLEISDILKSCFDECPLINSEQNCLLAGQCLFAKVIQGGFVKIGDQMEEL